MSQIPSSSPLWTPLKRRKLVDLEDLEPTVLFVQDSEADKAVKSSLESDAAAADPAGDIQCPATPLIQSSHEHSDFLGHAKPNRSISLAIFDSDSEIETERNILVSDTYEEEDELNDAPSEIQTSQWYESSQILEPKAIGCPTSPTVSKPDAPLAASTQSTQEPQIKDGEDDNTDTDNDVGDCDGATQNYLRELLTESMVESLPLPPANRRAFGMALH